MNKVNTYATSRKNHVGHFSGTIAHHEKKAKPASAPLCAVRGHSWQKTASDKIQRCDVKACRVVRFLVHGHWKHFEYSPKTSMQKLIGAQELQEQLVLWESEES